MPRGRVQRWLDDRVAGVRNTAQNNVLLAATVGFVAWGGLCLAGIGEGFAVGVASGRPGLYLEWLRYPPHYLAGGLVVSGLITGLATYTTLKAVGQALVVAVQADRRSEYSALVNKRLELVRDWRMIGVGAIAGWLLVFATFEVSQIGGIALLVQWDITLIGAAGVMGAMLVLFLAVASAVRSLTASEYFRSDLVGLRALVRAGHLLQRISWALSANTVGYIYLARLIVADNVGTTQFAYVWILFGILFGSTFFFAVIMYLDRPVASIKATLHHVADGEIDRIMENIRASPPQIAALDISGEIDSLSLLDLKAVSAILTFLMSAFALYQFLPTLLTP